jgi:hypothetical protein
MPKSRGRKRPKQQTIWQEGISPKEIVRRVLSSEQEAFKEKFGREWQPGDPIFFDPESDVPKPYPIDEARRILIEVMQMAKTPPEFIYAFKKTDMLLLVEDIEVPAERRKEWNDAIAEYFALERKAKAQRS